MKRNVSILWMMLIFSIHFVGCAKEPLTGVVTYKEYAKAHWSTNLYEKKFEGMDITKTETSYPARGGKVGLMWVKSKFKIWVTDNNKIKSFKTDSLTWCSIKCGQKITYDPLSKSLKK